MKSLPKNINLGGCIQYNGNNYEVDVEKSFFNSLGFGYDNNNEKELTKALEKSIIKIVKQVDNSLLKIHLIDYDLTRKFQSLNALKNIPNLINYVGKSNIKQTLENIEETIIEYNNNYLSTEYKNVCEYNNENKDFPLQYNIVVINFDYLTLNEEQYLSLIKLFKNGKSAGVYFYFIFNSKSFAEEIVISRKKDYLSNKNKVEFYEMIFSNSTIIYNADGKYKIQNTTNIVKDAFNRFQYMPNCNDVDEIVNSIIQTEESQKKNSNVKDFISIPIGQKGRQKYYFELGLKSTSYHAFIGGDTGMGKSNFINNLIVQIAENYSSDEIRLVLLDLKGAGGTEFQFYKEHPNVETLVLTSKLDIVEKIVSEFTNELNIRTELFNKYGVKNVEGYKKKTGKELPYKIMIIDEVQELFGKDWKTTNIFNSLLDKIGRQGRSYGIHMILSTQSLTDVNISNSVLNSLKLRISFKLSNLNDCRKIMDARGNNELPYDIEPYEIVYNNNYGKLKNNLHFLTSEIKTDTILKRLKTNHKTKLDFNRKIYTNNSTIKKEINNKIHSNNQTFSEVNLDDF